MLGFGVIITSAINYEMLAQSFARAGKQEMLYHMLDNNALTIPETYNKIIINKPKNFMNIPGNHTYMTIRDSKQYMAIPGTRCMAIHGNAPGMMCMRSS